MIRSLGSVGILAVVAAVVLSIGGGRFSTWAQQPPATPIGAAPIAPPVATPGDDNATVRIVHASADAGPVDVYVDGQPVASGAMFGVASDYIALPSGDHQVQIVPAGGNPSAAFIDEEVSLDSGTSYAVAAVGPAADMQLGVYNTDLGAVPANSARVRVVHAAPALGAVDLAQTGGDVLIEDVSFPDGSDYTEIPTGGYSLELRPTGEDAPLLQLAPMDILTGQVLDMYVVQNPDGTPGVVLVGSTVGAEAATPAA
jgi:hypothetical protein